MVRHQTRCPQLVPLFKGASDTESMQTPQPRNLLPELDAKETPEKTALPLPTAATTAQATKQKDDMSDQKAGEVDPLTYEVHVLK